MKSLERIAIVVLLCLLALGYLYQHDCSLRLAKQLSMLETERQLLIEELDSIDVDIAHLTSFSRLESLWIAAEPVPEAPVQVGLVGDGKVMVAAHYPEGR